MLKHRDITLTAIVPVFNEKLFAAKNATGKLKNAPITVPAQAINNDSPTLGTILSIASWERSRGNIAVIRIHTLLGAVKNLSGVISRPEADHKDPAMIRNVITYFRTLWFSGCFGTLIKFFFLTRH